MAITEQTMSDEQRKAVALEYLKRLDRGAPFFDLFTDDAQVYFPKWGLATGREAFEKLFSDLGSILSGITHDYAYFNYIIQGDFVVVEGTSSGQTACPFTPRITGGAGSSRRGQRFCDNGTTF